MLANIVQIAFWIFLFVAGLMTCAITEKKPVVLLGLTVLTSPAFYLGLLLSTWGDLIKVRWVVAEYRLILIVYGIQSLLLIWAMYLAVRLFLAKPGSDIDWWGRPELPSQRTIETALAIIGRASTHDMLNEITKSWMAKDIYLSRAVAMAAARRGPSAFAAVAFKTLIPMWYTRLMARRAAERMSSADKEVGDSEDREDVMNIFLGGDYDRDDRPKRH